MSHSLWIIGENHAVALEEIRSVEPSAKGGGIIVWKRDGEEEEITDQELEYLMNGILKTQTISQHGGGKLNYSRQSGRRFGYER